MENLESYLKLNSEDSAREYYLRNGILEYLKITKDINYEDILSYVKVKMLNEILAKKGYDGGEVVVNDAASIIKAIGFLEDEVIEEGEIDYKLNLIFKNLTYPNTNLKDLNYEIFDEATVIAIYTLNELVQSKGFLIDRYISVLIYDIVSKENEEMKLLLDTSTVINHSFILIARNYYKEVTGEDLQLIDPEFISLSDSLLSELEIDFSQREKVLLEQLQINSKEISDLKEENDKLRLKMKEYIKDSKLDLKQSNILFIGHPRVLDQMKDLTEESNGVFEYVYSGEHKHNLIRSKVARADFAIMDTSHCSHPTVYLVRNNINEFYPIDKSNIPNYREVLEIIDSKLNEE